MMLVLLYAVNIDKEKAMSFDQCFVISKQTVI